MQLYSDTESLSLNLTLLTGRRHTARLKQAQDRGRPLYVKKVAALLLIIPHQAPIYKLRLLFEYRQKIYKSCIVTGSMRVQFFFLSFPGCGTLGWV